MAKTFVYEIPATVDIRVTAGSREEADKIAADYGMRRFEIDHRVTDDLMIDVVELGDDSEIVWAESNDNA